jgi:hypothetical protein
MVHATEIAQRLPAKSSGHGLNSVKSLENSMKK